LSKFIKHDACPSCGSQDNLAVYDDHEYCFSMDCNHYKRYDTQETSITKQTPKPQYAINSLPSSSMPGIKHRRIDASTVQKYKVTVNTDPENPLEAVFPKFDSEGNHVANQLRFANKGFSHEGDTNCGLFGQTAFPSGGRSITITEGYYDAMAAFQITGSRYPNVGVQSAQSAKKEITRSFEYINSFDEIILNFDNDNPGQKAAKECALLFDPGKVKILCLRKHKDANDYLMAGDEKDYINEWFKAPTFMPDGLLLGTDMWDEIENHKTPRSIPYPWQRLNDKTYGIRTSELVLISADTGVGKTSVCKEIEYALLSNEELVAEKAGVGFLHFEEPKYDTAIGLMSIHKNKPYHLPDTERTTEELREAFDAVINTDRVVIWDHFGSNDIGVVLAKIRHMAALGCRYIMVDHLSIIVSDQSGDERKQLDEISTKLKTLTMNLDIAVFCVIHVNRQGSVRGSAGPEQVANIHISLHRDTKDPDSWRRNVTSVLVEKNRFCGRTGPGCYLYYNEMTGRLEELLDPDLIRQYEQGGSIAGHEFEAFG
jgi:twinkle protein